MRVPAGLRPVCLWAGGAASHAIDPNTESVYYNITHVKIIMVIRPTKFSQI